VSPSLSAALAFERVRFLATMGWGLSPKALTWSLAALTFFIEEASCILAGTGTSVCSEWRRATQKRACDDGSAVPNQRSSR
jgi:hypothetical protein